MNKINKSYPSEIKQIGKEEDRTLRFTTSTENIDRDGDILKIEGWQLDNYLRSPVILFGHDYSSLPCGKCVNIEKDVVGKRLIQDIQFPTKEEYEFADTVYRLAKSGYLQSTSVGFIGHEYEPRLGEKGERLGRIYTQMELLETSIVPVPSNPFATMMTEARSKGIINDKELKELVQLGADQNAVTVETRTEEIKIWKCPHCREEIGEKQLFHDGENWFHRPCKDAGPILLPGTEDEIKSFGTKLFEPAETKKADLEGNPSVWDIMAAIRITVNPTGNYGPGGPWIDDLYPVRYPSGSVVVEKNEKYYLYQYELKDGVVTLGIDFTELEEVYKPKSFERKAFEEKAGALLSRRNKEMLDQICKDMESCGDKLRKFIDTAGMMEDDPMMTASMTADMTTSMTMMPMEPTMSAMRTLIATELKQALEGLSFMPQKDAPEVEIDLDAIELPKAPADAAQVELNIEPEALKNMIAELLAQQLKGGSQS